jgi:hypothetical protein
VSGDAEAGPVEATSPLPEPVAQAIPTAAQLASGPLLTPEKILFFYSPAEWEQFVLEWAHALEEGYTSVKQFGGSGDRGIDVAGMLTTDGLRGEWDCYQCKHYTDSLAPSDVWPEICKIFVGSSP